MERSIVIGEQMSHRYEHNYSVFALWCGACVNTAWHIDVEAGFFRDEMPFEYAVEGLLVLFCEEDVVRLEFRYASIQCPVEGYAAT